MTHKFQSVQLKVPGDIASAVRKFQAELCPDCLDAKAGGLEDRPHVTVLYGLENQSSGEIKKIFEDFGPITVWFGKTKAFAAAETGKGYDVLYVEVLGREVDILHLLVAAYLPHFSTNPMFTPHMTLAYMKPGAAAEHCGDSWFEGQKATIDKIEFADVDESFKSVRLSEEMEIEGRAYARVPEEIRPLSGSIAAAFEYRIKNGMGWVPKNRLAGLLKLARELKEEQGHGN